MTYYYIMDIESIKNTVIQGDCLEVMKQLPDKCIDLVLTDPPYLIVAGGWGGAFWPDKRSYHEWVKWLSDWYWDDVLSEFVRICKKVNIYIFCSKLQVRGLLNFFQDYNYDILCYHKTNPTPTCNNKYLSDTEYIIFIREKWVKVYGNYLSKKKYFIQDNWQNDFDHPTVKPLNIIETLVDNSTVRWELVLDCFAWSWTTWVACKELWRNYILIEKEPKYIDIINKRLENITPSLF